MHSHEPPLLTHLIGDYPGFIDGLISALTGLGLDPAASRYELDHICYRCSSVAQCEHTRPVPLILPLFAYLPVPFVRSFAHPHADLPSRLPRSFISDRKIRTFVLCLLTNSIVCVCVCSCIA